MAKYSIYSSDGQIVRYEGQPRYNGTYQKVSFLEFTKISSPNKIPWAVGDYIDYTGVGRTGLRYRLYELPQPEKLAAFGKCGESFVYHNVQFKAKTHDLEIPFSDKVMGDNNHHFSTNSTVSTYENVYGIVRRIQACLDDVFPGEWTVQVYGGLDSDFIQKITESQNFSVSGTLLDVCNKLYDIWGIGWIHTYNATTGKDVLTFGRPNKRDSGNTTGAFVYGLDKGLTAIKKSIANQEDIATRLYVYGSSRNMLSRYYNGKNIYDAESVDIEHLMIPMSYWGKTSGLADASKAYLENSDAVSKLGLIIKRAYFDGSDGDYPEIYPSLAGYTIADVRGVMSPTDRYYPSTSIYSGSERIDQVKSVVNPTDDGKSAGGGGSKYIDTRSMQFAGLSRRSITFSGQRTETYTLFSNLTMGGGDILECLDELNLTIEHPNGGIGVPTVRLVVTDAQSQSPLVFAFTERSTSGQYTFSLKDWAFERTGGVLSASIEVSLAATTTNSVTVYLSAPAKSYTLGTKNALAGAFTMRLNQLGFNIADQASLSSEGRCTISMKTGMCAGRNFTVKSCAYDSTTDDWELIVNRTIDDDLAEKFPNSNFPIAAGDEFVLLDLAMPEIYISLAEQRLYDKGMELFNAINRIKPSYEPRINPKMMKSAGVTIQEGMYMHIQDTDIVEDNVTGDDYVIIDTLTIIEGEDAEIPTYSVSLREEKRKSFQQTTNEAISDLKQNSGGVGGTINTAYANRAGSAEYAEMAGDSEKWNGRRFPEVMDQTVRTTDPVQFAKVTTPEILSPNFSPGMAGAGYKIGRDENGNTIMEIDNLTVRKTMKVFELIIQQLKHQGGIVIYSAASMECTSVEELANGYKCYFDTKDGQIPNEFAEGDQARCQRFDLATTEQKYYWRLVTGVGDGYIVLSKSDCDTGSDVPEAGDIIVQFGNRTDETRQALKITTCIGSDTPRDEYYKEVSTYDLTDKLVTVVGVLNGRIGIFTNDGVFNGQVTIGEGSTGLSNLAEWNEQSQRISDAWTNANSALFSAQQAMRAVDATQTQLDAFELTANAAIRGLQDQIDGQIDTWFHDYDPTTSNAPASDWNTTDKKKAHVGDLFYNTASARVWRWVLENGSYKWKELADDALAEALKLSKDAKDLADSKRRIFYRQPLNSEAYEPGDLWVDATYETTYSHDILRCKTGKAAGEVFNISHWVKASNYTDDTALNAFINDTYTPFAQQIEEQVDKKAETWYQSTDPSSSWSEEEKAEHVGDMWFNTATTTVAGVESGQSAIWTGSMWKVSAVPQDVFDQIDGKAAIYTSMPSSPNVNDLLIPASNITSGGKTYYKNHAYKYNGTSWNELAYTDDTTVTNFINGTYSEFVQNIQSQVDEKTETFYQSSDPSTSWTTAALKSAHIGDLWYNTSATTIAGVESGQAAIWTGSAWKVSAVPKDVFDQIDGKAAIYNRIPANPNINDLLIPTSNFTQDGKTYYANHAYKYNGSNWVEFAYTDDAALTNFINNTYNVFARDIQNQVDGKAETWYQSTNPAANWSTQEKTDHKGDIWYNTSSSTIAGVEAGQSAIWNGSSWKVSAVPKAVFDQIDGKSTIYVTMPTSAETGDLLIPTYNFTSGGVTYLAKHAYKYNGTAWVELGYTDDTTVNNFINNTYGPFVRLIQDQVDAKAETFYQSTNPAANWTTSQKAEHIGDMWCNTSSGTIAGVESNQTAIWSGSAWIVSAVPKSVFDKIDGKATIYTTWPTSPQTNDLLIPSSNIIKSGVTYQAAHAYRYNGSAWIELAYTDNSALNAFISGDYASFVNNIQSQVDKKAQTWYQNTNPASSWTSSQKLEHTGDLWYNTSTNIIAGVEPGQSAIWNGSEWKVSAVPSEVFDAIDGKSSIYVTMPTSPDKGDLLIPTTDFTSGGVTYRAGLVYKYTGSAWEEVSYAANTDCAITVVEKETLRKALADINSSKTGTVSVYKVQITGRATTMGNAWSKIEAEGDANFGWYVSNNHEHGDRAVTTITVVCNTATNLVVHIMSRAESSFDYACLSPLDTALTWSSASSGGVTYYTPTNQVLSTSGKQGQDLTYTYALTPGTHTFQVAYRKDYSASTAPDNGYYKVEDIVAEGTLAAWCAFCDKNGDTTRKAAAISAANALFSYMVNTLNVWGNVTTYMPNDSFRDTMRSLFAAYYISINKIETDVIGSDLNFLKAVFSKATTTITGGVVDTAAVVAKVAVVTDDDSKVVAGINGTKEVGYDATHKKLMFFGGANGLQNAGSSPTRIYEDGYIKTSKLDADGGVVGGFEISPYQMLSTQDEGDSEMLLSANLLRFHGQHVYNSGGTSWVFLGHNVMPASTGGHVAAMRIEIDRSDDYNWDRWNVGLYLSIKGEYVKNYAIYAASGMFAGLRPGARLLTYGTTLTEMDHTLFVNNSSNITIYLPSTPQPGQEYEIWHNVTNTLTITALGSHYIQRITSSSSISTSHSSTAKEVMKLVYDPDESYNNIKGVWMMIYFGKNA